METKREIQKNTTVYNFDTIDVDGKPEVEFKCLKRLVGERGFEPPTPWVQMQRQELTKNVQRVPPRDGHECVPAEIGTGSMQQQSRG